MNTDLILAAIGIACAGVGLQFAQDATKATCRFIRNRYVSWREMIQEMERQEAEAQRICVEEAKQRYLKRPTSPPPPPKKDTQDAIRTAAEAVKDKLIAELQNRKLFKNHDMQGLVCRRCGLSAANISFDKVAGCRPQAQSQGDWLVIDGKAFAIIQKEPLRMGEVDKHGYPINRIQVKIGFPTSYYIDIVSHMNLLQEMEIRLANGSSFRFQACMEEFSPHPMTGAEIQGTMVLRMHVPDKPAMPRPLAMPRPMFPPIESNIALPDYIDADGKKRKPWK